MDIVTLTHGQPRYAELLARIEADDQLVGRMWQDAESRPSELDRPGTLWTVATVSGQPAAWCAARVEDGILRCHSNYEAPAYRRRGFYAAAYRQRHRDVVRRHRGQAVTYLFAEPVGLHLGDGWQRTGTEGAGELPGHWWYELRRAR